mmetsp:Transcript_49662/g.118269  ORF Transcript_49662/g.118269 Transcript_49662/m.118269 type:complete len:909 (+) Transcript_49662:60-2786(+)
MAQEILDHMLRSPVPMDFGMEFFAKHPSGIGLQEDGVSLLKELAEVLSLLPEFALRLEGHVPGKPEDDDPIRRSVAEEAAELCRAELWQAGVQNEIVCEGKGCSEGIGLCVRMSKAPPNAPDASADAAEESGDVVRSMPLKESVLAPGSLAVPPAAARIESELPPPAHPAEEVEEANQPGDGAEAEPIQAWSQQPIIANAETQALEMPMQAAESHREETLQPAETQTFFMPRNLQQVTFPENQEAIPEEEKPAFDVPEAAASMDTEAQKRWLDDFFNMVEDEHPMAFVPNKANVEGVTKSTVVRLAEVLRQFPNIPVKVVGHSKGKIQDNKESKRILSHSRAEAVAQVLEENGATNHIAIGGYGSALGRGMLVRLHVMTDEEVASGQIRIPDIDRLSKEEQEAALNQLLKEALSGAHFFEPSRAGLVPEGEEQLGRVLAILQDFPPFPILCEGHAKGRPTDNSDAKVQLSKARAEVVTRKLTALGACNRFVATGCGSSRGGGMGVRMIVWDTSKEVQIPDTSGMSEDHKKKLLNQLLEEALRNGISFLPNRFDIPPESYDTIQAVTRLLQAFPGVPIKCEGHSKGRPADNDDAKRHLSLLRAETVKVALRTQGVLNDMQCTGEGSVRGLGMGIRMFVADSVQVKEEEAIPDVTGLSTEEIAEVLNGVLDRILSRGIAFEPNAERLPPMAADTVTALVKTLRAFEAHGFALCCEGHAKGQREQDTELKRKLSYRRAESLKAALKSQGVKQYIQCIGLGSSQGLGMRVRMYVQNPDDLSKDDVQVPDLSEMSAPEQFQLLSRMLEEETQRSKLAFEPNRVDLSAEGRQSVRRIAHLLKAFPEIAIVCEGHSKGKPEDNNSDKVKLSEVRAQAVKAALVEEGAPNQISFCGRGCEVGLGMRVCLLPQQALG